MGVGVGWRWEGVVTYKTPETVKIFHPRNDTVTDPVYCTELNENYYYIILGDDRDVTAWRHRAVVMTKPTRHLHKKNSRDVTCIFVTPGEG